MMTEKATETEVAFCFVGRPETDPHLAVVDLGSLVATDDYRKTKGILAFLRESQPIETPTTSTFDNPAWSYCLKQGGTMSNYYRSAQGPRGDAYGICRFDDDSRIGQWTLLRKDRPLYDLLSDRFPR